MIVVYPMLWHTFPLLSKVESVLVGLLSVLLLYVSIFLHETAHAKTAEHAGYTVSHIDMWLLGGMSHINFTPEPSTLSKQTTAQPPTTTQASEPSPTVNDMETLTELGTKKDAWNLLHIAVVGPVTSLFLAATFGMMYFIIDKSYEAASVLFYVLALLNLVIALFNLLPGLPLDGGNIVRSVIWIITGNEVRGTHFASRIGQIIALAIPVGVILLRLKTLHTTSIPISVMGIALSIVLGFFLWTGSSQGLKHNRLEENNNRTVS